jgi:hypothetical protein
MARDTPRIYPKEDPDVTKAAIAYIHWRIDGGQGEFEPFKRRWLIEKAERERKAMDGTNAG